MEREYDQNAGASSQHQRIRSCPLDLAGTLYAQGELAGARKLEEQMLEALAPDMKAHGGGGEVGELSQVAALGDGENDVEMLKES